MVTCQHVTFLLQGQSRRTKASYFTGQAPEKFLVALAVLGAARKTCSHFNLKVTYFRSSKGALDLEASSLITKTIG